MTPEHAQRLLTPAGIALLQAHVDGKTIEMLINTKWDIIRDPQFNSKVREPIEEVYRVKREPRVLYVRDHDGDLGSYTEHASDLNHDSKKDVRIKFVEVL